MPRRTLINFLRHKKEPLRLPISPTTQTDYTLSKRRQRTHPMTNTPGIVITGASGRMGQMLVKAVMASDKCHLVGALERTGHAWVGQDIGTAMGGAEMGVTVTDDALEVFAKAQAVIDFTAPAATVAFAGLAAQARAVHVIGTTGLTDDDLKAINAAYECLKDPQKRAAYDRFGHAAFQQGGPGGGGGFGGGGDFGDIGDIFETIFGGAFGGGGRQQARRGAAL